MEKDEIRYFADLMAEQIANERPGQWGDYELLDVWQHFIDEGDREQETAVLELILRSPDHSELIDYGELYYEVAQNHRLAKVHSKAIGWLYAAIAYEEQHEPSLRGRLFWRNSLAEAYLYGHEFSAGLALFAQNLRLHPGYLDTYNIAAMTLADVGLHSLVEAVIERALSVAAIVDDEGYNDQWKKLLAEIKEADEPKTSLLSEVDEDVLEAFQVALALPIADDFDEDASQPFIPPIDQLVSADALPNDLADEILSQYKVFAPELIRLAFSDLDSPGPAHAVALLRQLRDEETALFTELSPWLDKADGDWQESLSQDLGKIGGFSTAELKTIAADTTYDTFVRTGATKILRKRLEQNPELHEEIVTLFRHLLNRPEAHDLAAEEAFIGFLIGDVLDADLRELYPDIQLAFTEDRVDPSVIGPGEVEEEWDLPFTELAGRGRQDGLNLQLRCTVCERSRFHFTRHVLVDTITLEKQQEGEAVEFDAHILDHEIICPKCGSVDQYRLTHQAHIALLGQQAPETMLAMLTGQKPDKIEKNPRVHYKGSHALGGPMHPLKAIQRYQKLIAAQPHKTDLQVRLGGVYLFVMRFEQGLRYLRQVYEVVPDDIEVVMRLAMAEHDFGDRERAKALYQQVFKLARQDIFSKEMIEMAATARDGLKALQRGDYSPMEIPISASVYYGEPEKEKKTNLWRPNQKKKSKKRR